MLCAGMLGQLSAGGGGVPALDIFTPAYWSIGLQLCSCCVLFIWKYSVAQLCYYRLHHVVYLVSYLFFTLLPLPRVSTPSKFSIPLFGPQRWAIGHLADDPEMVGNF